MQTIITILLVQLCSVNLVLSNHTGSKIDSSGNTLQTDSLNLDCKKQQDMKYFTSYIINSQMIQSYPANSITELVDRVAGSWKPDYALFSGLRFFSGFGNDVLFLIDGIRINDPFSNNLPFYFDLNSIKDIEIIKSGIPAQYGDLLSGVVNIRTKVPGIIKHTSYFQYLSSIGLEDDIANPGMMFISGGISGPIPFPGIKNLVYRLDGIYRGNEIAVPGFTYKGHNNSSLINGKFRLDAQITDQIKLSSQMIFQDDSKEHYNHQTSANAFWHEKGIKEKNQNKHFNLSLAQQINEQIKYDITFSKYSSSGRLSGNNGSSYTDFKAISRSLDWVREAENQGWYNRETGQFSGITEEEAFYHYYSSVANDGRGFVTQVGNEWVWNIKEAERDALNSRYLDTGFWEIENNQLKYQEFDIKNYQKYLNDNSNPENWGFRYRGDIGELLNYRGILGNFQLAYPLRWEKSENEQTEVTGNFSTHFSKSFSVDVGGFYRTTKLNNMNIEFFDGSGIRFNTIDAKPVQGAVYLQNKFSIYDFTLFAGMRWDYYNPDEKKLIDLLNLDLGLKKVASKTYINPRLSLVFNPFLTSQIKLSYNEYIKPVLHSENQGFNIFKNDDRVYKSQNIILDYNQLVFDNSEFGLSFFYKDQIGLQMESTIFSGWLPPLKFEIKGFEFNLFSKINYAVNINLAYTYSNIKALMALTRDFYYEGIAGYTVNTKFDVKHQARININFRTPENTSYTHFAGLNVLGNITSSFLFYWHSGFPYTPSDFRGNPLEPNSAYLPDYKRADLRIQKGIFQHNSLSISIFADIINLFNTKNVVNVYPFTGKPDDNGDSPIWDPDNLGSYYNYERYGYESANEMYKADLKSWKRLMKTPLNYGLPRLINFGIKVSF